MRPIRFLQHYAMYNRGEVAGFEDAKADELVADGVAKEYLLEDPEFPPAVDPPSRFVALCDGSVLELRPGEQYWPADHSGGPSRGPFSGLGRFR